MATRLNSIVIDAAGPVALGTWWAEALGWRVYEATAEETDVGPHDGSTGIPLVFVPVGDPKTGKNRVHLDLAAHTRDEQQSLVETLERLGATRVDVGQGEVPWVVLADPEGNEFCVLEYREQYADRGALASIVVDAASPGELARFWSEATGWPLVADTARYATLGDPQQRLPDLDFLLVADVRTGRNETGKNRLHLDVRPAAGDDLAEQVQHLVDLGATRFDVGQGEVPWVVLADPEGNAFCVLSPR